MQLKLTSTIMVSEVQKEFNDAFPFLKIDFYKKLLEKDRIKTPVSASLKAAGLKEKGAVVIHDNMTVAQLENIFRQKFGLMIQVSRKSGNTWLETTMTDGWTLKQQNDHGRELSQTYKPVGGPYDL